MKICKKCGQNKPLTEFHSHRSCRQGVRAECKACYNPISKLRSSKYRTEFPEKRRSTTLKSKYGISLEQYEQKLQEQAGCCKICKSTNPGPKGRFAVDHCHKTGKVRSLLCYLCNIGLGSFRDDVVILNNAIEYLRGHNG